MNRLNAICDEFVNSPVGGPPGVALGERGGSTRTAKLLDERLKVLRGQLEIYFMVCVAMIALLFVAQLALILIEFGRPELVKTAVATCGVSTLGLVALMCRLWRDRDRTGTIIALAQALEPDDLRAVLNVMLQEYGPRRPARPAASPAAANSRTNSDGA
jgi:hypothetical protein